MWCAKSSAINGVIVLDDNITEQPVAEDSTTVQPANDAPQTTQEAHLVVNTNFDGAQLLEARDAEGREWDVLLIQTGLSKNNTFYSKKTLSDAVHLFEGAVSFADHTNEVEQRSRPERSIKDKVGRFSGVRYDTAEVGGKQVEGLRANFKVVAPWLREMLVESVNMGEHDFVGFSIDAYGPITRRSMDGKQVQYVDSISKVRSVDVVTTPSAGGRLMRLVASDASTSDGSPIMSDESSSTETTGAVATAAPPTNGHTVQSMSVAITPEALAQLVREAVAESTSEFAAQLAASQTEVTALRETQRIARNRELIDSAIGSVEISSMGREQLHGRLMESATRRDLTSEEIVEAVRNTHVYEAALMQSNLGTDGTPRARVGSIEKDKMVLALRGLFDGEDVADADGKKVPAFRSIKEAYCRWTGKDFFDVSPMELIEDFFVKYDSAKDHKRIAETVSTTQWGQIYADVFYLKLLGEYKANPMYAKWRMLVSEVENVPDFQLRHFARVGGYSDLATVSELATYPMLTSPDDEEVTYRIGKRGGLDDLSFEAITNDRVGATRRTPRSLARAAARTMFKFFLNLATTDNPTMGYDSVALYNSGSHLNTGAASMSVGGLQTVWLAMRKQTAYGESSEILGERNLPKIIIIPPDLEQIAQRVLNPSDSYLAAIANPTTDTALDPAQFRGRGLELLVYDQLTTTDVNDWYAVADPAIMDTMVAGFLNGQQDPELYIQNEPTNGAVFTADKITYKVRHIYGGAVLDHRSFYKATA